jgi:LuxR family transcriptional regulator, regulator of acetate metabolism
MASIAHIERTSGEASAARLCCHQERLWRLHALRRRLSASADVGSLFALAADLACSEYGFERGLVLSVDGNRLTADASEPLSGDASDRLRRQMLAAPVTVTHEVHEAEVIRLRSSREPRLVLPCALESALDLRSYVLAPIVPESRTLGLLLVDREDPIETLDSAEIVAFADIVAGALTHVVLRARQQELASELRQLTASTHAMMRELLEAPVALPCRDGQRQAFPLTGPLGYGAEDGLRTLLSESETRIAALLVQGLSNRAIADELIVSPETVKAHVARILRKLGASNRVEAVSMILRLSAGAQPERSPATIAG